MALYQSGNQTYPIIQAVELFTAFSNSFTAGTGFYNSGLNFSITPKLATSKILVIMGFSYIGQGNAWSTIFRNGTNILDPSWGGAQMQGYSWEQYITLTALDSPATTSLVTYDVRVKTNTVSGIAAINTAQAATGCLYAYEIAQ